MLLFIVHQIRNSIKYVGSKHQKGEDLTSVVEEFLNDYKTADFIVGHIIDFDKNVVGAEIIRIGLKDIIDTKPSVCTMKSSTDYCALYTEWEINGLHCKNYTRNSLTSLLMMHIILLQMLLLPNVASGNSVI